jgi:hypothetical protein
VTGAVDQFIIDTDAGPRFLRACAEAAIDQPEGRRS